MEELKQELEQLFDEMIHKIQLFKKKTYSPAFLEAYQDHRNLFSRDQRRLFRGRSDSVL